MVCCVGCDCLSAFVIAPTTLARSVRLTGVVSCWMVAWDLAIRGERALPIPVLHKIPDRGPLRCKQPSVLLYNCLWGFQQWSHVFRYRGPWGGLNTDFSSSLFESSEGKSGVVSDGGAMGFVGFGGRPDTDLSSSVFESSSSLVMRKSGRIFDGGALAFVGC